MSELDDLAAEIDAWMDAHGFLSWLGLEIEALEDGVTVFRVPYKAELLNPEFAGDQSIHGGVAATLVDACAGLTVRSGLAEPVETGLATIDLNISYLRPATGDLVARGEVDRIGGSVGVASVVVESETNGGVDEVAVGRASFRIFRP